MGIAFTLIAVLALSNCYRLVEFTTDRRVSIKRYVYSHKFKLTETLAKLKIDEETTTKVYVDLLPVIFEAIRNYYIINDADSYATIDAYRTRFIDGDRSLHFEDSDGVKYSCDVESMHNRIAELKFINLTKHFERLEEERNMKDYQEYVKKKKRDEDTKKRIESIL